MDSLLHRIDKKLAILEALSKEHSERTENEYKELRNDIKKVQEEITRLKVRVATISGGISLIVGFAFQYWSR